MNVLEPDLRTGGLAIEEIDALTPLPLAKSFLMPSILSVPVFISFNLEMSGFVSVSNEEMISESSIVTVPLIDVFNPFGATTSIAPSFSPLIITGSCDSPAVNP